MRFIEVTVAIAVLTVCPVAAAEPVTVDVHVISRDAKFIGTSMGGVHVTITDTATGEVLAQGVTEGGTGDTDLIMGEREHGAPLVTEDTAGFSAALDIHGPTRVQVGAHGPLDYPHAANTITATQWLLPHDSERKQRWILEMPGLVVDVHDTPVLAKLEEGGVTVPVSATVRMMCGCPLTPDGLWDSNEFDVHALVEQDGVEFVRAPLEYAGEASEFAGDLLVTQPGTYRLSVRAHQPRTGNAGLQTQVLIVE